MPITGLEKMISPRWIVRFATTPKPLPETCLISNGGGLLFGARGVFFVVDFDWGREGVSAAMDVKSEINSGVVRIEIPRFEEKVEDV